MVTLLLVPPGHSLVWQKENKKAHFEVWKAVPFSLHFSVLNWTQTWHRARNTTRLSKNSEHWQRKKKAQSQRRVFSSRSGIFINCENIFICDDTNRGLSGTLRALKEVHHTELNSLEVQGKGIRLSAAFHCDILRIQSFRGFHPSVDESARWPDLFSKWVYVTKATNHPEKSQKKEGYWSSFHVTHLLLLDWRQSVLQSVRVLIFYLILFCIKVVGRCRQVEKPWILIFLILTLYIYIFFPNAK